MATYEQRKKREKMALLPKDSPRAKAAKNRYDGMLDVDPEQRRELIRRQKFVRKPSR
jgi:hypothetical protein